MVLPLIPAALIAVGAVTGCGGLALGGKGALDLKKAQIERAARSLSSPSKQRRSCR